MSVGLMTSSELIEAVKRRAFIPNTQPALSDDDILRFINEEMSDSVIPLIMSMHEEYFLTTAQVPLVANKQNYKIPYRAIGRKLRDVKRTDSYGNLYAMTRIDPSQRDFFEDGNGGQPSTFYLRGDEIVMMDKLTTVSDMSLELMYYLKPNELVLEKRVGTITAIDLNTGIITLAKIPTNFAIGSTIDFLEAKFGNRTLGFDASITNIDQTGLTVTVSPASIPSDLVVGDYIALAGECIIPQIPVEMHSILAERAAARCLASLGDANGVAQSNAKINDMEGRVSAMIDTRTEGQPQKINNLNSLLRRGSIGRRGRGVF